MEYMAGLPDKAFDLAIVDPPYGIGEDGGSNNSRGSSNVFGKYRGSKNTTLKAIPATQFAVKNWDKQPPPKEYFSELLRVSINQIVFGANHFISRIPIDSSYWIVWDKNNGGTDFADCELAWTSFKTAVRKFKYTWNGMLQEDMKNKEKRIHPTQKPTALYKWILQNYAQPGDKILDIHGGSMSSAIACHQMGFDLVLTEIDNDYYDAGVKRFNEAIKQQTLFTYQ